MLEVGLFWLGIVLVAVAILMLFLDSFQSKKIWAVISLLLLIPLIIHMFTHWSSLNVRKALYILIIGVLGIAVSISGGALSHLSFLPDHEVVHVIEDKIAPPVETPLPNQQQADDASLEVEEGYDPLLTGSEYEQLEVKEIVPEEVSQVVRKPAPTARYEVVTDEQRVHAINKRVRAIMNDGSKVEGVLTAIIDESVIIESDVSGGSLGLSYKNDQIQSIAVRLLEGEQLVPEIVEEVVDESIAPEQAQQPISESQAQVQSQEPEIELEVNTEVVEKVEQIVDDTKLLDSVDGQ